MAIIEDRNGQNVNFSDLNAGAIFQFAYAGRLITAMKMVPSGQYRFQFADLADGKPYQDVPSSPVMHFPNATIKTMKNSSIVDNLEKPSIVREPLPSRFAPVNADSDPQLATPSAIFRHINNSGQILTCLKLLHSASAVLNLETGEMHSILPEVHVDHLPHAYIQLSPPPR